MHAAYSLEEVASPTGAMDHADHYEDEGVPPPAPTRTGALFYDDFDQDQDGGDAWRAAAPTAHRRSVQCCAVIARGARRGERCGTLGARRFIEGWRCARHARGLTPCDPPDMLVHFGPAAQAPTLAALADGTEGVTLVPDVDGEALLANFDYINCELPGGAPLFAQPEQRMPLAVYTPADADDPLGPRLPLTRTLVAAQLARVAAYVRSRPEHYAITGAPPLENVRLLGLNYDDRRGMWRAVLRAT